MDAFLKLPEITEAELGNLVTQAEEDLQKRIPRNVRSDLFGAIKLTFRHLSKGISTYSSRPVDGIPLLEHNVVEVSNKRSGGNPKVRLSSTVVDTSHIALITVADSDGAAHFIRLIRCACCVEENDGWFPISRLKSVVTVVALPLSLHAIRDELRRRHERLMETKRSCPNIVDAQAQIVRKVQRSIQSSPRKANKRRVTSEIVHSERGRCSSLRHCVGPLVYALTLVGSLLVGTFTMHPPNAAKDFTMRPSMSAKVPAEYRTVKLTDGVPFHRRPTAETEDYYRRFLEAFKSLEGNETRVKSWLDEIRHPKNQRSWAKTACIKTGKPYDYIDQLKAVVQDMSMMLHKMSRWMDMDGRDDDIRALMLRLGLFDSKFSYRSLVYAKSDEVQDVAEFAYLFWGHVEEFLAQPSLPGYEHVNDVLLLDATALRYWVGQRWTRLGQTWRPPLYAKYEFEPRSEDGNFVQLPYEYSVILDE